ncbi:MAG: HEAT repeat domain-containing protein [Myxococcales bacterium]|nr:HEAT repeat domain-containing protein [Myxococcales bacterium]
MALFGLFGKKSETDIVKRAAERVANKRAQAVDRWEAIHELSRIGHADAVRGLLKRFTFYVDPSITDQEEKDAAFEGVVAAGEAALEPVVEFMRRAESISWPLKILTRLVEPDVVVEKLLELLSSMDTEYERDPQCKIQVLSSLEERPDPRIAVGVVRFLEDSNETVRFHAAGALFAQADAAEYCDALIEAFCAEESVRIRMRILDGFIAAGWDVGTRSEDVSARLPSGYKLDRKGTPSKS